MVRVNFRTADVGTPNMDTISAPSVLPTDAARDAPLRD